MTGIIYSYVNNVNNKRYIGSTIYPNTRHKTHLRAIKKLEGPLYLDVQKYGLDNFKYEVLESDIDESQLGEREKYWILYYDSINNGYNKILGASGRAHTVHTENTKLQISKSQQEYWDNLSEEEKQERIKKLPIVHLNGSKNGMYNRQHTLESKKLMSETKKKRYIKRSWINKDNEEKLIPTIDLNKYILDGWNKGRK